MDGGLAALDGPPGELLVPADGNSMSLLLRRRPEVGASNSAATLTSSGRSGGQRRSSSGSGLAFFIRSAGTPREDRNGKPDQEKETLKETFPLAVQKEEEKDPTVRVLDIAEEEGNKETEEDFENTGFPPSPPRAKKSDPWNPLASLIRPARQALDWLQSPRKRTLPSPVLEDGVRALPTLGTTRRHKKFRVEPTSHRRDLPFLKMWQKSSLKASRKKAVELASGAGGQGRHSIEKKFFANSTIAPRASKRETIRRVLGAADKFNHGLIDEDALKTLASLLQESNYKSGKAYVIEAKVWHVESGGSWSPAMDRTFKLCKKALDRGQGPPNKAPRSRPSRGSPAQASASGRFAWYGCSGRLRRPCSMSRTCTWMRIRNWSL